MKKFLVVILSVIMALSLVACGGGGSNQTTSGNDSGKSAGKDSVVVATATEPVNYYPLSVENDIGYTDALVTYNVYEAPLKMMPDGTYEGLLAESWDISEDGTVYTLHLRDDVTFHSGNKMTAEDVAYSLNVEATAPNGKSLMQKFKEAVATDDKTVEIHLTEAYAPFLAALASEACLIVEKAQVEAIGEEGFAANPQGTGPYKFVSHTSGDSIVMEANEDYWGGAPAIKQVKIKVLSDVNAQVNALESGDVDVLINAPLSQLLKLPEDGDVQWTSVPASMTACVNLNCAKGLTTDINFRRALQSGINKSDVALGTYEGAIDVLEIPVNPIFTASPKEGTYKVVEYDVEQAKKYLADSSYNGEEFSLYVVTGTKEETAAQIIQGELQQLGINCSVKAVDVATFMSAIFTDPSGNWDSYIRANTSSNVDSDSLNTSYGKTGHCLNAAFKPGWGSDKVEELLAKGRAITDEEERRPIYAEVCDIVTDEVWSIPLYGGLSIAAYNKDVKGVEPRPLQGVYFINEWSY